MMRLIRTSACSLAIGLAIAAGAPAFADGFADSTPTVPVIGNPDTGSVAPILEAAPEAEKNYAEVTDKALKGGPVPPPTEPTGDDEIRVVVSPTGLNLFRFAVPFRSTVFEPDAPVADSQAIGDKDVLVVHLREDAHKPFQMVVSLTDKRILNMTLIPSKGSPAANWSEGMAPQRNIKPIQRPEDSWIAETFQALVSGKVPEGFRPTKLPAKNIVRYYDLTATYVSAYASGPYTIYGIRLSSDRPTPILPHNLYRPDVKAVLIDGDRVGDGLSPMAYVIMVTGG